MIINDVTIRIGGAAGDGVESNGIGFCQALVRGGLHVFGLPDYHSRIRGGHNFYSIRVSDQPLYSHAEPVHLLLALTEETIPLGIFYQVEDRPAYEEQVPALQAGPLVKQPLQRLRPEQVEELRAELI